MEIDPLEPRLKVVAMDGQNWLVRGVGLQNTYKTLSKNPRVVSSGVVGLKSLIWPGWSSVSWQNKYSSIYIGYGYKNKFIYYPREPELVMK